MTALKARHSSHRLKSPSDMGLLQPDRSPSPNLDLLETSMEEDSFESRSRHRDLKLNDSLNSDDSKRFHRGSTIRKNNSQYHKLFKEVPEQELLRKDRRSILISGEGFEKELERMVTVSVTSVVLVKKHRTAGLLPNGLVIRTKSNEKYIFVSFISRDNVYDELRKICSHLQHDSKKSLIVSLSPDMCDSLPLDDYRLHLDLKRKLTNGSSSSLPEIEYQSTLGNSTSSLSSPEAENSSYHSQTFHERVVKKEKLSKLGAAEGIGKMEYGILRILIVM
ncbi:hypothetical protein chiPu_0020670 [Chiloscyllium punctatum]|uniref:GRAM domain-containing protein n=1 Tax=Chiloscyllium punctatum TaxID=137246 RepID=A0A401RI43_CHIPU|nr:hypothetical protein [Chiloscyllium punctatum]